MFCLTHQERKVLLFIGILILIGSILRFLNANATKDNSSNNADETFISEGITQKALININKAYQKELEDIPGIGAVIASRVIEYRLKFGPFRNSDDIKKVKGIGNKKIKVIRKYITF